MSQEWLEALMLCAVEKNLLKALSTEGLVAQFAAGADRRLDLGWDLLKNLSTDGLVA